MQQQELDRSVERYVAYVEHRKEGYQVSFLSSAYDELDNDERNEIGLHAIENPQLLEQL